MSQRLLDRIAWLLPYAVLGMIIYEIVNAYHARDLTMMAAFLSVLALYPLVNGFCGLAMRVARRYRRLGRKLEGLMVFSVAGGGMLTSLEILQPLTRSAAQWLLSLQGVMPW